MFSHIYNPFSHIFNPDLSTIPHYLQAVSLKWLPHGTVSRTHIPRTGEEAQNLSAWVVLEDQGQSYPPDDLPLHADQRTLRRHEVRHSTVGHWCQEKGVSGDTSETER